MKELLIEFLKFTPEITNLLIAFLAMRSLLKLTQMRIAATVEAAKGKNPVATEAPPKGGFWSSLAWVCVHRLAELIIAGIAIPDIPVLIKLITG